MQWSAESSQPTLSKRQAQRFVQVQITPLSPRQTTRPSPPKLPLQVSASPSVASPSPQASPSPSPKVVQSRSHCSSSPVCTSSPVVVRKAHAGVAVYPTLLCSVRSAPPSFQLATKDDKAPEDQENALDQHVAQFLASHPQVRERHLIIRKGDGEYELDGREVTIEFQHAGEHGSQGSLVVVDGPLRQPFLDYLEKTEHNAEYEAILPDSSSSSLHSMPKDKLISFNDQQAYSRLDAMKVAKEQALVREKAVGFLQAGQALPQNIMDNYQKSIQKKLAPVSIKQLRERAPILMRSS